MANSKLYAGFSRVNITPSIDTPIIGYYVERRVEGVLDELEINAAAFELDGKAAIVMSVDNCAIGEKRLTEVRLSYKDKLADLVAALELLELV